MVFLFRLLHHRYLGCLDIVMAWISNEMKASRSFCLSSFFSSPDLLLLLFCPTCVCAVRLSSAFLNENTRRDTREEKVKEIEQ